MVIPLRLPRTVEIVNPRLTVVYVTLLFATFIFVVWNFFGGRAYVWTDVSAIRLHVSLDGLDRVISSNSSTTFNHGVPLCSADHYSINGTCVGLDEAFVQHSSDEVFLMSSWRVGQSDHIPLLPLIDVLSLRFQFEKSNLIEETSDDIPSDSLSSALSGGDQPYTEVLDGVTKEPMFTFKPGDPIMLSPSQIVDAACGPKQVETAAKKGNMCSFNPNLRRAGIELMATVDCRKRVSSTKCFLQFEWGVKGAAMQRFVSVNSAHSSVGPELLSRKYYGLHVRSRPGTFRSEQIDGIRILLYLSSAIIYLTLPTRVLGFIVTRCLGHLSHIYRNAVFEPFNIVQNSAHAALRLVTSSVQFVDLACMSGGDGITLMVIYDRLQKILARRGDHISESELKAMATFVYRELQEESHNKHFADDSSGFIFSGARQTVKDILEEIKGHTACYSDLNKSTVLDIDAYSEACASNDKISFSSIVQLFDKDRPRTCMERFFTPIDLRSSLKDALDTEETSAATTSHDNEDVNGSAGRNHPCYFASAAINSLEVQRAKTWGLSSKVEEVFEQNGDVEQQIACLRKDFEAKLTKLQDSFQAFAFRVETFLGFVEGNPDEVKPQRFENDNRTSSEIGLQPAAQLHVDFENKRHSSDEGNEHVHATPVATIQKAMCDFLLSQECQNHILSILDARLVELEPRLRKRFALVERAPGHLAATPANSGLLMNHPALAGVREEIERSDKLYERPVGAAAQAFDEFAHREKAEHELRRCAEVGKLDGALAASAIMSVFLEPNFHVSTETDNNAHVENGSSWNQAAGSSNTLVAVGAGHHAHVPQQVAMGLIKSEISAVAREIATIAAEVEKNGMSEELAKLTRSKQLRLAELISSMKTHEWTPHKTNSSLWV